MIEMAEKKNKNIKLFQQMEIKTFMEFRIKKTLPSLTNKPTADITLHDKI